MAVTVKYEISSTLTRPKTNNRRTPWHWTGQIIISGLTSSDRLRAGLPINNSQHEIIPMSGITDEGENIKDQIAKILEAKVKEIKDAVREPKIETKALTVNKEIKATLTQMGDLVP